MANHSKKEEPRDQFTLRVIGWIRDAMETGTPPVKSEEEREKEYFTLLDTPLEAFER